MFSGMFARASHRALAGTAVGGTTILTGVVFSNQPTNTTSLEQRITGKEKVVIVGGGSGGIGVAAMLTRAGLKDVTIIEPKDTHLYQPLWSLVGGGVKDVAKSSRPMTEVVANSGAKQWIQQRVKSFDPKNNTVEMEDGTKVDYDYLVVAAGIQTDWDNIPGLTEGLKKSDSGVVSIYDYHGADKTWKTFQNMRQNIHTGSPVNMIFTMSPTGIKCAGAPQKIMWLLEDTLRGEGLRDNAKIGFWTPGGSMFGVPYYAEKLEKIRQERGVEGVFKHDLVSIDVSKKIATFKNLDTNKNIQQAFDMLHVAPHMSAPTFLRGSPISDDKGWVDVDQHTLQSKKFSNVFGIGDCTNTPNSKTAAAITSQAPVLVHNMMQAMEGKQLDGKYNGYASCPLIIGRSKIILAEFGYGGKRLETFAHDTGSFPLNLIGTEGFLQQRFFYLLKEQLFPFVYWNLWTRGLWYGTTGPFRPTIQKLDAKEVQN